MKQYHIVIRGPREKVKLIKMIRTFGPFGLKQAKDLIEDRVDFDSWMDEEVTLTLVVSAEMLGNRHATDFQDGADAYLVTDVELIKPMSCDINLVDNPPR